ncbi:hypothetical protein Glove_139g261 [Diversispora epigaea]|uniref:Uncharacterized protein n=1 Tax=Diversispora epigaea TaxID=1348612 RepID=A0A397IZG7_9GLOM|nr:hypothetical protein Glove_139g261 [Diversispora epigaea]
MNVLLFDVCDQNEDPYGDEEDDSMESGDKVNNLYLQLFLPNIRGSMTVDFNYLLKCASFEMYGLITGCHLLTSHLYHLSNEGILEFCRELPALHILN